MKQQTESIAVEQATLRTKIRQGISWVFAAVFGGFGVQCVYNFIHMLGRMSSGLAMGMMVFVFPLSIPVLALVGFRLRRVAKDRQAVSAFHWAAITERAVVCCLLGQFCLVLGGWFLTNKSSNIQGQFIKTGANERSEVVSLFL